MERHFSHSLQEFSPAIDNEPYQRNKWERSANPPPDQYEVVAQMACTSMVIINGKSGFIYAVHNMATILGVPSCSAMCVHRSLRSDPQTKYKKWIALGGMYVYKPRPHSYPSWPNRPSIGLKVKWISDYMYLRAGSAPNYCCCFVPI